MSLTNNYVPLRVRSHDSLLSGLSKPQQIIATIKNLGINTCALTDHTNVSGIVQFCQLMLEEKLKPLIGCEVMVCKDDATIKNDTNSQLSSLVVFAKNINGWNDLMELVSLSNRPEHYYNDTPRLDLTKIRAIASRGNLLAYSGHIESHIANCLFEGNTASTNNIHGLWRNCANTIIKELQNIFGIENFYLATQRNNIRFYPKQSVISDCVRQISEHTKVPILAIPDSYYCVPADAEDHRVLLCLKHKTQMKYIHDPAYGCRHFFDSASYHIPSYDEMISYGHTEQELANTIDFASKIESFSILRSPILPDIKCPDNLSPKEYFRKICRDGFKKKCANKHNVSKYIDRIKEELELFEKEGLSAYFLIVRDILEYVRSNGWSVGCGRGSVSGCLTAYLSDITAIDSIEHGLLLSRFFNPGRRGAMPDIDIDVPKYSRGLVIQYLKEKYKETNVAQVITFHNLKGRSALKDIFRVYGDLSNEEVNEITKNIIEEHKITDELEEMRKEYGSSSIIMWCLENQGEKLKNYCYIDDDRKLRGPFAQRFEQAIRLEGTKTGKSRHASAIVVTSEPVHKISPLVLDNDGESLICGLEKDSLEMVGGLKFDVLGLTLLDKLMGASQDLEYGEIKQIS